MGLFVPIVLGVGSLLSAAGDIAAGDAAEAASKRKAEAGEQNARLAEEQAEQDELSVRYQFRKIIGANRASIGASGVTMEGSPMEVLRESAANAEHDVLNIRRRGQLQARSYRLGAEADLEAGANAKTVSRWGAAAELLSGAGRIGMTQK